MLLKMKGLNMSINEFLEVLQNKLGSSFKIETREQLNAVFHKMLNTENLVSYLVLI